jgi:hypothetical protein
MLVLPPYCLRLLRLSATSPPAVSMFCNLAPLAETQAVLGTAEPRQDLSLMSKTDSELESLCAKRTNRPLGRFGYFADRRLRLRMGLEFLQVVLGPFATFGALLNNFGFFQLYSSLE